MSEPVRILLAEDDDDDFMLTTEAFKDSRLLNRVYRVKDGVELMEFLHHQGPYEKPDSSPAPSLILLDLNMPRRNGFEVLAALKADAGFLSIPIVVLTTSSAEEDIERRYALHANAFITKPGDYAGLAEAIRQLTVSFLGLITLPPP